MRSYYAHLETTVSVPKNAVSSQPVFRASAIFPVIQTPEISSRVIFLGYWILKRHIQQIACVVTLRTEAGQILNREQFLITEPKAYRVELANLLSNLDPSEDKVFFGSMEIEFYSTANLFFPYPAVAINYYGSTFSSVVHTAQRVYNNFDDLQNNSQSQVPEAGFNLYADQEHEPLIGLINGPEAIEDGRVHIEFFNLQNEKIEHTFVLGKINPYQTSFIYPNREVDLTGFFKGNVGTAKIHFRLNWIFPRLLIGNINRSLPAISITHSYYDCSSVHAESDYWLETKPGWYPASAMIPLRIEDDSFTNIYFYPIYSPSRFLIDVEIYNQEGKLLGRKGNIAQLGLSSNGYSKIQFRELCEELHIEAQKGLAARVIAHAPDAARVPARIKIALDIGHRQQMKTPCNICLNLQPFNPAWEAKPSSFKWTPLLADQPKALFWIMNSSPAINHLHQAEVKLTFYRERDTATLSRELSIPPQGFHLIRVWQDPELLAFFEGKIGWCTAVSSNPYTTTYYFADHPSGAVGGDHGF